MNNADHIRKLQQQVSLYEDMKAYEELYNLFFDKLNWFCFSFTKSHEAAEEIVSDVFIKIWEIRGRLTEIDNLQVYLYTIAKNFCLNYITKNFKNPVVSLDNIDFEITVGIGTPEDLCISSDLVNKIKQTILQLPPQCRLIFQMVKEDGLQYKEVAEILNLSVFTVRNQLAIAIRKLSGALPGYSISSKLNKVGPAVH